MGGQQKRCFTDVSDGVEGLYRIIENENGVCDGKIINLGNPENDISIKRLAELLHAKFEQHPMRSKFPPFAGFRIIESGSYYGTGYQDVQYRKPSIRNAKKLLDWIPNVDLEKSIENTLEFFLQEHMKSHKHLMEADSEKTAQRKIISIPIPRMKKALETAFHKSTLDD